MKQKHYLCEDRDVVTPEMGRREIRVLFMDEAVAFVRSLPLKVQKKVTFNYNKIERGVVDSTLLKKLEGTEIWELRTVYEGLCYRLFAFWDTEVGALIIATHGIVKKTQRTPIKEVRKAESIRRQYFDRKER